MQLKIHIAAAQSVVWKALVKDTSLWWPKDFYTSARTKGFVIEPKLGGRAYEDAGRGEGLIWYSVLGVEAPDFILMSGYVAPPFGGPATSLLRLTLSAVSKTLTLLEVVDSSFGHVGDCDKSEGWRLVFEGGLKRHLETKP